METNKSKELKGLKDRVRSLEELFKRTSELEDEVLEKKEEENVYDFIHSPLWTFKLNRTLRKIAENNDKSINKINSKLQAILDHLGQEYVEITEKNGDTKTFHKLRKKTKKVTQ